MRKISIYIMFTLLFLVFATISVADENYPLGCCIGPYQPEGNLLGASQDTCAPNVWVSSCYQIVADTPQLNPAIFEQRDCCCLGVSEGYADETIGTSYTTSDVLHAYCDAKSGTILSSANCASACLGGISDPRVIVSGLVTTTQNEEQTTLSDIQVTLELDTGAKFETTTENGEYELLNVPVGQGVFILTTPIGHPYECDSYTSSQLPINSNNNEYDFNLICEPKPGACIPNWQISDWSECTLYAGSHVQTREVIDTNECGLPLPNATTRFCDGFPLVPGNCGDSELNQGEQCDTTIFRTWNQSTTTSNLCELIFGSGVYGAGTVSCTDQCTYDISLCQPACGDVCDHISKCGCDVCTTTVAGNQLCNQECSFRKPEFLATENTYSLADNNVYSLYDYLENNDLENSNLFPGVQYALESRDVTLSWDFDTSCTEHVLGFSLQICKEHGDTKTCAENTKETVFMPSPGNRTGILRNVLKQEYTSYCYNVCSVTTSGDLNCAYESGNLPCFLSGSNVCMYPLLQEGYNCEFVQNNYHPAGCHIHEYWNPFSNLSLSVDYCPSEEICVETTTEPGAQCRPLEQCEKCNGLFGLYANYNLDITLFDGTRLECNNLQHYGTRPLGQRISPNTATPYIGVCYKDTTLTAQPAFNSCEQVTSCYGYQSKLACENDPCMRFQNGTQSICQWNGISDELGLGVCSPKQQEQIECGRCDIDSPLGFCTPELCQTTYGQPDDLGYSACYYNTKPFAAIPSTELTETRSILFRDITTPAFPTCQQKQHMGCAFYDTKTACLGEQGNNATFNVVYDIPHDPVIDTRFAQPTGGDNTQNQTSDDYFGFGNCQWIESQERCVKNSDSYFFHQANIPLQDDCIETTAQRNLRCLADNKPPTTTILWKTSLTSEPPLYGINELLYLPISVEDNAYLPEEITTYFSITSEDDIAVYPNITYDVLVGNDAEILESLIPESGTYTFAYFSKDPAKNLEIIQTKTVSVDMTLPEVTIEYDVQTNNLSSDRFVSTIDVQLTSTKLGHCRVSLYDFNGQHLVQPINDKEQFQITSLSTTYVYIPDGNYRLKGFCRDEYFNQDDFDVEVRVQADKTITESYPYGQVFGVQELDAITFSLRTANKATCRVSQAPFTNNMPSDTVTTLDTNNEGLFHQKSFIDVLGAPVTSGSYTYYVQCEFTNTTGDDLIIQNIPSHTISLTIDGVAPASQLFKRTSVQPLDFSVYNELGENWEEAKVFRIICSDESSLTPFGDPACAKITHCLLDKQLVDGGNIILTHDNFEDHCEATAVTSLGTRRDILIGDNAPHLQQYGQKYLYYFGEDKFGNVEQTIRRADLRIRSTAFPVPSITIV